MTNFKKLALLCTALLTCATLSLTAGCSLLGGNSSSSENESSIESSSTLPEESSEDVSSDTTIDSSSESSSDSSTTTTYTVTVNNGTGSGSYEAETEVEISCNLPEWKEFDGWYDQNNELISRKATFTLYVESDITLTPSFIDVNYTFICEGTLNLVDGWDSANIQEFKVAVPEAGTYALSTNSIAQFGEIKDGLSEGSYTFTVEEAGEVTLYAHHNNWEVADGTEVEVVYTIYEIKGYDFTEVGEYNSNMLANASIPFSFTAPAAGTYRISTSLEAFCFGITEIADIYNDTWTEVIGTYERISYSIDSSITVTLEEGQSTTQLPVDSYSAWAWIKAESAYNYVALDLKIEYVETIVLKDGDTTATIHEGEDMKIIFTPTEDNVYTFTATNENCVFGIWNESDGYFNYDVSGYSNTYNVSLKANEEFVFYIKYNNYDNPVPIEETISVTSFVSDDPSKMDAEGKYTFTATLNGTSATFTAPVAGTYEISDGYNNSIDGVSSIEVTLAAGESHTFMVYYDGIITLTIVKLPEIVSLSLGENTVTVPEGENTLELNVNNGDYTLIWSNEDVIVNVNGTPYTSGTMLTVDYWSSFTITTSDGTAIENVTFTLNAFVYPTVKLGDNTVNVNATGTTFKFMATEPGCYTFTIVGETVTNVSLDSMDSYDYPNALDAAGTISINVKPNAEISLSVKTSEDSQISVNVALTSTTKDLETSVVMNDDNTQPVSLTIDSLPNGTCAYYVATKMMGDYTISWSADYDIIVYTGENVGTSYNPEVRLTRTALDGNVYLVIRNSNYDGMDYENIVLNFAIYEEPVAEPQGTLVGLNEETTIEIAAWENAIISFVAPEAGTYTLTTTSSVLVDLWVLGNWGYDRTWFNVINSEEGGSYTFTLEEGGIIDFFVMEYDFGSVSFVFTITQA